MLQAIDKTCILAKYYRSLFTDTLAAEKLFRAKAQEPARARLFQWQTQAREPVF